MCKWAKKDCLFIATVSLRFHSLERGPLPAIQRYCEMLINEANQVISWSFTLSLWAGPPGRRPPHQTADNSGQRPC